MKKVINFILAAFMLIGTLPMLASADGFDPSNFETTALDVRGYSSTDGFMVAVSSLSSLGITADDHEKLVGCMINGTVTTNEGTVTLTNAVIGSTIKSDDEIIRLNVGEQNITHGWFENTGCSAALTLSPKVDLTNFSPITLDVQGYSETQGFMVGVASLSSLGITADDHEKLVGCMINGTVTTNQGTVTLTNAAIQSTVKSSEEIIRLWVGTQNIPNGWFSSNGGSAALTLSPKVDLTNFSPITLDVQGYSETQGFMVGVASLSSLGITADDHEKLVGCLINGTVTTNQGTVTLTNAAIQSTVKSSEEIIRLWVGTQNIPNGWFSSNGGSAALTLSPASDTPPVTPPAPSEDETNFTPFEINVNAIGSTGTTYDVNHVRFVVANNFTFSITEADQLAGCVLNGTVTRNSDGTVMNFNNLVVAHQSLRGAGDNRVNLEFVLPEGSAIDFADTTVANYTFDLTISPAIDSNNFAPFKITVNRTGTPDETTTKRLLVSNTLGIDTTVAGQLTGCYLNGTVTYDGDGAYSKVVILKNVPVTQEARAGEIQLDFTVPAGYSICLGGEEDDNYTWNLTLSREEAGDIAITDAAVSGNGISMTVNNDAFDGIGGLKLIVAAYNANDEKVDMDIIDLPNIAIGDSETVDSVAFTATDWTYSRVFIWYDLASMIPMADDVRVSK